MRRRGRRAARAAALLAAALARAVAASAQEPAAPAACSIHLGVSPAEASARLVEGARVFDERCSPCHGERGSGDGTLAELLEIRPRNYHADPFRWGTSWTDVERTVRLGRSDVMPSFEGALSDEEIRSVAFLVACWVARRTPAP